MKHTLKYAAAMLGYPEESLILLVREYLEKGRDYRHTAEGVELSDDGLDFLRGCYTPLKHTQAKEVFRKYKLQMLNTSFLPRVNREAYVYYRNKTSYLTPLGVEFTRKELTAHSLQDNSIFPPARETGFAREIEKYTLQDMPQKLFDWFAKKNNLSESFIQLVRG